MKIGTWLAIYFVVWWTVLFAVLPFAVRRGEAAAEIVSGADPGAPVRPRIMFVVITTSILSFVLLVAVVWLWDVWAP